MNVTHTRIRVDQVSIILIQRKLYLRIGTNCFMFELPTPTPPSKPNFIHQKCACKSVSLVRKSAFSSLNVRVNQCCSRVKRDMTMEHETQLLQQHTFHFMFAEFEFNEAEVAFIIIVYHAFYMVPKKKTQQQQQGTVCFN